MKPRVPYVALELTRDCRLVFEWDEMFTRCVISLSRFKFEKQLRFATEGNIMLINRLQDGLIALVT